MKLETKIEYLRQVPVPLRVLYFLGCMRFGEEKFRVNRYHERLMETGLYIRFWHPLMVIAVVAIGFWELCTRLLSTVKGFAKDTRDEFKDGTPCGYTLYRRADKHR